MGALQDSWFKVDDRVGRRGCPRLAAVPAGVGEEVVEVYSNSSSAPNSASSTFLRRPSETTRATVPPTTPSRRRRPTPPRFLCFLGAS